jgi:hypothetical protein
MPYNRTGDPDVIGKIGESNYGLRRSKIIATNVLQLPEGGDFSALHCQPSRNFDKST